MLVNVGEQEYVNCLIYMLMVSDVNNDNYVCNVVGIILIFVCVEMEFRVLIDFQIGCKWIKVLI